MNNWFNKWFKKENNKNCLICKKIKITNEDIYHNRVKLDAVYPSEYSKELCSKCYENFVLMENHLRNCETTKFYFKSGKEKNRTMAEIMGCKEHLINKEKNINE